MKFPDKLDVLTAHARLIEETGGSAGISDEALLELLPLRRTAIRMRTLIWQHAVRPMRITSHKHAFVDGNKRVAAAVAETFLESNGSRLVMTDKEIVRLFVDIAAGLLNRDEVERLLRAKIKEKNP